MKSKKYQGYLIFLAMAFHVNLYAHLTDNNRENSSMTVTGHRFTPLITPVLISVKTVTRDDIDSWQAKSINDVLRLLPGVDIAQMGGTGQQSSVFIRGTNSNHVLILVDGIRMGPSGMSGSVDLSQFPLSLVQKIDYMRGPGLAVYGSDAMGGVINIITHRHKPGSMLTLSAGSSGYQRYDITTQQKTGDSTLLTLGANYTGTKGEDVVANASRDNSQPDSDGFSSKLLWLSLEHEFNNQFSGFAQVYGVENHTDYDGFAYQPPALLDTRQLYGRTYNTALHFKEGMYSAQLLAGYSHNKEYNYDPRYGPYHHSATLDNTQQYSLQWSNSWRRAAGAVNAGTDWRQQSAYLRLGDDQVFLRNIGIYLTGHQQIKNIILEGALRHDNNSQFAGHSTWHASVGWEFTTDYRLVTSYGTAFKAPNLMQLYSNAGSIALKPEESRQWENRIERLTAPVKWSLAVYANYIDQLIDYNKNHYENLGSVKIHGVEWISEFDTGPLTHQVALNYLDPRDSKTGEVLLRRAKQQANYQLSWPVAGLDWSVMWHYIGPRHDKIVSGIVKLGGTSVWDIAVSYPMTANFTVRVRIANLLDKHYETVYGYPLPGRGYYCTASYAF
jgi:vitamin B12 transporter